MRTVFETIGILIASLFLMAIPILCALSFVYNWVASIKFFLIVVCIIELFGLASLLAELSEAMERKAV